MRPASPLKIGLLIAACLPAALAQSSMQCSHTNDIGGYAYRGTIAACGDLIRWVTSIDYGTEFVFPGVGPKSGWRMEQKSDYSHCSISPRDFNAQLTEERIPIIDIWTAIETLRYGCTIGSMNIGNQWQVSVATENHVGKRYARSQLSSREVSNPGSVSHKAVARAAGDERPPAYGAVVMMQVAIDVLGLAGIYYAMMLRNHPHLPTAVTNAIPGYQNNQEDGVVRQLSQDLIAQMDTNREGRNTLFAGPQPVTLLGVGGQWSLSARLELPIPPEESDTWHWAHPLSLLDSHTASSAGLPNEMADQLAHFLRGAFVFLGTAHTSDTQLRRTSGFFIWQLNGAQGAIPEDETSNLPDIGPYVRIYVERAPNSPTPTITAPNPTTNG